MRSCLRRAPGSLAFWVPSFLPPDSSRGGYTSVSDPRILYACDDPRAAIIPGVAHRANGMGVAHSAERAGSLTHAPAFPRRSHELPAPLLSGIPHLHARHRPYDRRKRSSLQRGLRSRGTPGTAPAREPRGDACLSRRARDAPDDGRSLRRRVDDLPTADPGASPSTRTTGICPQASAPRSAANGDGSRPPSESSARRAATPCRHSLRSQVRNVLLIRPLLSAHRFSESGAGGRGGSSPIRETADEHPAELQQRCARANLLWNASAASSVGKS